MRKILSKKGRIKEVEAAVTVQPSASLPFGGSVLWPGGLGADCPAAV
jgi:hypothetical protein